MIDAGIIISRFQVDELSPGHRFLIDTALRNHRHIVVLIGCGENKVYTPKDPLDYPTRQMLVLSEYPMATVAPIFDVKDDNALWSKNLDTTIRMLLGMPLPKEGQKLDTSGVKLYGGRDSFAPYYSGEFQVVEIDSGIEWSGSFQREQVARCPRPSKDFRAGAIYAITRLSQRSE